MLRLTPLLNGLQPSNWNFDLDDCDKILRVDSPAAIAAAVVQVLLDAGFDCEELVY